MSLSPRWSPSPMLVTTATSQRSKASPSRRMPPRAVSKTARLDARIQQHAPALCGPLQSLGVDAAVVDENAVGAGHAHALTRAAEHMGDEPRRGGLAVDARDGDDRNPPVLAGGKEISTIASPTGREMPTDGSRCMRSPGAALTSTIDAALFV